VDNLLDTLKEKKIYRTDNIGILEAIQLGTSTLNSKIQAKILGTPLNTSK
jgi:hypothetical protein